MKNDAQRYSNVEPGWGLSVLSCFQFTDAGSKGLRESFGA